MQEKTSRYNGDAISQLHQNHTMRSFHNERKSYREFATHHMEMPVSYNDVFYRDENGMIQSDDPLGREMILRLKLHHPCHALEYIVERIEKEIDKLTGILKQPEVSRDMPSKERLEKARLLLCLEYTERSRSLRKTYKQKLAANGYESMG